MAHDETYVWVNRWQDFQTYTKRRGKPWAPPWIKLHGSLLNNPDYLRMTIVQRSLLLDLWLLFALTKGLVPLDLKFLNTKLGRNDKLTTYEALNHAGFVSFCSGTVREQLWDAFVNGSPLEVEVEVEVEVEKDTHQSTLTSDHNLNGRASEEDLPAELRGA